MQHVLPACVALVVHQAGRVAPVSSPTKKTGMGSLSCSRARRCSPVLQEVRDAQAEKSRPYRLIHEGRAATAGVAFP